TEYAWNMGWCDPCAAPPLDAREMRQLGVFWLDQDAQSMTPIQRGGRMPVTLTRLHVRYDAKHFPEDLVFQETGDQQNFQGRYVIRHPWRGSATCAAAGRYQEQVIARHRQEAERVASLTGWDTDRIRQKMGTD